MCSTVRNYRATPSRRNTAWYNNNNNSHNNIRLRPAREHVAAAYLCAVSAAKRDNLSGGPGPKTWADVREIILKRQQIISVMIASRVTNRRRRRRRRVCTYRFSPNIAGPFLFRTILPPNGPRFNFVRPRPPPTFVSRRFSLNEIFNLNPFTSRPLPSNPSPPSVSLRHPVANLRGGGCIQGVLNLLFP